jgi:hypothetical protein
MAAHHEQSVEPEHISVSATDILAWQHRIDGMLLNDGTPGWVETSELLEELRDFLSETYQTGRHTRIEAKVNS